MKKICFAIVALLSPILAHAHSGHGLHDGLNAGLLHPLTGLDHLLAMLAVGYWAALQKHRYASFLPVAFMGGMLAGGLLPSLGVTIGSVEHGIALTVLLLGGLLFWSVTPRLWVSLGVLGVSGALHGFAHGAEVPQQASLMLYMLGFSASTCVLHLCGWLLAKKHAATWINKAIGCAYAITGCTLLLNI